jgi:glutamine amidotransferase
MIAILKNTGGTNLSSVCHALNRIGAQYQVTDDAQRIRAADRVILPGVGSAAEAMKRLKKNDLIPILRELTQPVLGICLGMQLLFRHSAEGDTECLGVIPGNVFPLKTTDSSIRIPHMGWNKLNNLDAQEPLCRGLPEDAYAYFIHSFAAEPGPWVKATTAYGQNIPALVKYKNFYGCQFHPEKSARVGDMILKNFIEMDV